VIPGTDRWFAVRFDPRHAAKSGMPGVVPVPADRIEEVKRAGIAREQAIDWIETFLQENPEHDLGEDLRRFVDKARMWDRAVEELQKSDWERAAEILEDILAIDPADAAAHFNLGAAFRNLRRYEEALKAYAACEEVFSDEGLYFSNRGRTLQAVGRGEEAVRDFEEALRLMPGDSFVIERLVELGALVAVYQDVNDPGKVRFIGRADFQAAVRRTWEEPGRDAAFFLRAARAHTAEGQAELGVEAADRAAALDPGDAEAPLIRALALVTLKRFDEAEAAVLKHLASEPVSSGGHAVLGRIQLAQGRVEGARGSLERAVDLDPNQAGAVEALAALEPDPTAAMRRLRALAQKHPTSWAVWSAAAAAHLRSGEPDQAFEAFEKARQRGAGDEVVALYFAELGKAGRLERMVEVSRELGDLSRRAEPIRWTVAIALKSLGRRAEGTALLEQLAGDAAAHPAWRRQAQAELRPPPKPDGGAE
jgi:tetratricopeptide (TPR) repeat protein